MTILRARLSRALCSIAAVILLGHPLNAKDLSPTATQVQIKAELASLILSSDRLGRALFAQHHASSKDDKALARIAWKTAMAAVGTELCEGSYDVVLISGSSVPILPNLIPLSAPDNILAYLIGWGSGDQPVMLGRSFRVELTPDGRTAHSVVASTRTCTYTSLASLEDARDIGDGLGKAPTEFHVFLSLVHQAKFRVRTEIGLFEIDNGTIHVLALDPAYKPEVAAMQDCQLKNGTTFRTTEKACRGADGTVLP
jgi:hypothetical protein